MTTTADRVLERQAGRVLCVDPVGRVLLVGVVPPGRPEEERVWLLPGGGCEPGETRVAAALRELAEETGLVVDPPEPEPVLVDRASTWHSWAEGFLLVEQVEDWFAVRTGAFDPVLVEPGVYETPEATTYWWAAAAEVEELAGAGRVPAELPDALARAHALLGPEQLRPSSRVLLVDPDERVLLMRSRTAGGEVLLFPVGGGVLPGETHEDGARREVEEETGRVVQRLLPAWRRRHAGRLLLGREVVDLDVRERWFWARVPSFEPDVSGWEADEALLVDELAWYGPQALAAARQDGWLLVPRDLDRLLPVLLAGRAPAEVGR